MKISEKLEDLGLNGLKIIQNYNLYNFTCDAVLLSSFLKIKHNEIAVEIGTGSGVISILANEKNKPKSITCFEIQKPMAELAVRNFELNKIDNIKIINDDVNNYEKYVKRESFDVVFSNPPYKKKNASFVNENECKAIARHEIYLDINMLVKVTSELLKFGGKCYFCYDANRVAELIFVLKQYKLEPKELQFSFASKNKDATLILIKAIKGGKEGVRVMPPLFTNDENGKYIETLERREP